MNHAECISVHLLRVGIYTHNRRLQVSMTMASVETESGAKKALRFLTFVLTIVLCCP